jgi:hypothetical protein
VPGNQIVLTSNHQPTLVKLGKKDGVTSLALDGGGFPLEVAVAFNLLKPPPSSFKIEYVETVKENVTICIPHSLSVVWNWRDGETRIGGTVRVVTDNFSDSDPLPIKNVPALLIRLYTALRLTAAHLVLMSIPIAIINLSALIPIVLVLLLSSLILVGFWNQIPGNGWGKGVLVGFACVGIMALFVIFQILSFQPLFLIGVFISISWLGGLFMGTRSTI